MDADRIRGLVPELNRLVAELEAAAPGRSFTLDGHLLSSIGEALAPARYALGLTSSSTQEGDAIAEDGREVQIKCTAGRVVALHGCPPNMVVLRLKENGSDETVYNGSGERVWAAADKPNPRNGQRKISLSKLACLQEAVPASEQLPAMWTSLAIFPRVPTD